MEDYVYVLDYLPKGRGDLPPHKRHPTVYGIGENQFTLLELVPKNDMSFNIGDRIYVGKDPNKRKKINKRKKNPLYIKYKRIKKTRKFKWSGNKFIPLFKYALPRSKLYIDQEYNIEPVLFDDQNFLTLSESLVLQHNNKTIFKGSIEDFIDKPFNVNLNEGDDICVIKTSNKSYYRDHFENIKRSFRKSG